jgi:hypothetical protein
MAIAQVLAMDVTIGAKCVACVPSRSIRYSSTKRRSGEARRR